MRPGRQEIQDGKDDLLLVLKNSGRYDMMKKVQGLADFNTIMARLKELVDENDMEYLRNSYRWASEWKSLEKSHEINMAHLVEALTSIVNKNSGEQAIKKFFDLQVQSGRGVSKQADGFKEAIGDILLETFSIKTVCNCTGVDQEVVVKAAQIKDLLAIFVILARLPKDENASYQGKIRELLNPYLEDMSSFSMKTF